MNDTKEFFLHMPEALWYNNDIQNRVKKCFLLIMQIVNDKPLVQAAAETVE